MATVGLAFYWLALVLPQIDDATSLAQTLAVACAALVDGVLQPVARSIGPRLFARQMGAGLGREALAETGDGPRLTYAELWDRAARVAGGLRSAGVGRGDRVAIRLGNGVDWVLAFFGTVLAAVCGAC